MSFVVEATKRVPQMGVLVSRRKSEVTHLVATNGKVLCNCYLWPDDVILVEDVDLTPSVVNYLCGESLRKYKEITR